jgi:hypothetical protein
VRSLQKDRDGTVTVNGAVNAAGNIISGVGFSVSKTGTGAYTVRFPQIRALLNAVTVPASGAFLGASLASPSSVGVVTYNSSATPTDYAFTFSVTGLSN